MNVIQSYRAVNTNFNIYRGDNWVDSLQFVDNTTLQPVNLSTYTSAKLQIKKNELSAPLLTLTTTGNTLSISGSTIGIINIKSLPISLDAGNYLYDLQFNNATIIETLAYGLITIVQDITT